MRSDRHRPGFTLIELLVAIAIIGVLSGASLSMYSYLKKRARWDQTRVLVKAVGAAISTYSSTGGVWTCMTAAGPKQEPLWDIDHDGLLDGPPNIDTVGYTKQPPSRVTQAQAVASGYGGFQAMTAFEAPKGLVQNGILVDGWWTEKTDTTYRDSHRLRVAYGSEIYGPNQIGVYSTGPDGIANNADDLKSWTLR